MLAPHPRARSSLVAILSVVLAVAFLLIYLSDLATVPFHPDESNQLYMSRDFNTLFLERNPPALAWLPGQPMTPEIQKRLLDAPLTRYTIGLGWWLRGYTVADLNEDWAWGAPWEANLAAVPAPALLLAARTPVAVLGALSAVLLFWIGVDIGGAALGLTAALLLALDPLLLLHARRAMAESLLTFFSLLAIWGTLRLVHACDASRTLGYAPCPAFPATPYALCPASGRSAVKPPSTGCGDRSRESAGTGCRLLAAGAWVGVLVGLAMAAKQSELTLLPAALLITALALMQRAESIGRRVNRVALVAFAIVAGSALTFLLLNPVLWSDPWAVSRQMIAARVELASSQVAVNGAADPGLVLAGPPARVAAAAVQLYWQMPSFWDVPVYLAQLQPPAQRYLAVAWHVFLRETPANILLIALSVLGVAGSAARLARLGGTVRRFEAASRRRLGAGTRAEQLLWIWTLLTLGLLALSIPLNWQRYFMPLLPASRLFAAMGLVTAVRFVALRWKLRATFPRAWWSIDRA